MIDWSKNTMSKKDYEAIDKIADRAQSLAGVYVDRMTLAMDLEVCNMTCPIDLDALLAFDEFNLAHDVFGITNHLNRETGELEDCFVPRCAK